MEIPLVLYQVNIQHRLQLVLKLKKLNLHLSIDPHIISFWMKKFDTFCLGTPPVNLWTRLPGKTSWAQKNRMGRFQVLTLYKNCNKYWYFALEQKLSRMKHPTKKFPMECMEWKGVTPFCVIQQKFKMAGSQNNKTHLHTFYWFVKLFYRRGFQSLPFLLISSSTRFMKLAISGGRRLISLSESPSFRSWSSRKKFWKAK